MNKLTMLCAAAIILCSTVIAQNINERLTVHFTTPVMVGETKLPAGACDIQVVRGSSNNTVIIFRSESGISAAAVANRISASDTDSDATSIVLNRHGNDMHLYRVMLADHIGYELNQVE